MRLLILQLVFVPLPVQLALAADVLLRPEHEIESKFCTQLGTPIPAIVVESDGPAPTMDSKAFHCKAPRREAATLDEA